LIKDEPAMQDDHAAYSYILQFATRIFLSADNEDRSGHATKKTGRLFFIASQFLEVLRAVGSGGMAGEEVEERIKYAKWKAMDIVKALNEGRVPAPGPPGSAENLVDVERRDSVVEGDEIRALGPDGKDSAGTNLPSFSGSFHAPPPSPVIPGIPTPPSVSKTTLPPTNLSPPPPLQPAVSTQSSLSTLASSPLAMADAEKHSRYALSAIQFDDVVTAIKELEYTLALLRSLQNKH